MSESQLLLMATSCKGGIKGLLKRGAFCPILLLLLCVFGTGCTYGFIYTDTVTPLTTNLTSAVVAEEKANSSYHSVKEPVSGYGVRVEWASYGIGDTAVEAGLEKINYADLRYRSVLGGIWQEMVVVVYGSKGGEAIEQAEQE